MIRGNLTSRTAPILVLTASLLGCGGSDSVGATGVPVQPPNVQVRHVDSEDVLVEDVSEFHYTGLDADGNQVFGKQVETRGESDELSVPLTVVVLQIEYFAPDPDGEGQILRHVANFPVDLSDGGELVEVFPEDVQAGATLPTTLINNSAFPLNVYVFGVLNGTQSFMNANGVVVPYTAGATVPSVATIPAGGRKSLSLPAFQALGRVYFSKGNLPFSGWELAPSYARPQLFDFVEYTYTSPTLVANTTCVDAMSLPFVLQTTPASQQNVGGWFPPSVGLPAGARTRVFNAVQALGAPWNKLIVVDNQKTPIRLLAPWRSEALNAGFPANVLNASINNKWGKAITLNTYGFGTYTAPAAPASGNWTFTPQGGGAAITFGKPSSTAAFSCVLPLKTAEGGSGQPHQRHPVRRPEPGNAAQPEREPVLHPVHPGDSRPTRLHPCGLLRDVRAGARRQRVFQDPAPEQPGPHSSQRGLPGNGSYVPIRPGRRQRGERLVTAAEQPGFHVHCHGVFVLR